MRGRDRQRLLVVVRHGSGGVVTAAAALALLTGACVSTDVDAADPEASMDRAPTQSAAAVPTPPSPSPSLTPEATPEQTPPPDSPVAEVDGDALREVLDRVAGRIGPREATSEAYSRAARFVERRFAELGYDVERRAVGVPAGESWGISVPAGESRNVVAVTPGADLSRPHLVVGAHLDTVPQAPGGVDNASGVSVVLELARLAMLSPPPQPVVFVAFGAEEPRGPGDDLHHFGSQSYVAAMPQSQREALIGAIAIDSVGISREGVPVCSAGVGPDRFTMVVRATVEGAGVRLRTCENRTSDHWSFVRDGLPGVRVGLAGTEEYAEYHSAADTDDVVADRLLIEAASAVWAAVSHRW